MKKAIFRWLFSMVLFAGLSASAVAQVGMIRGEVKDPDGKPLNDALIEIQNLGIKRILKTNTDKNGKFLHAGVPIPGNYRVVVRLEGYTSDYAENVRPATSMNDNERGVVDFVLNPGPSGVMAWELTEEERAAILAENARIEARAEELKASQDSFEQAIADYDAGNYQAALDGFIVTAEGRADEAVVWANMANTYMKLGNAQKALESYNKAILLSPDQAAYYQNRGGVYAELGDQASSNADYEKAVSLSSAANPAKAAVNYSNMGIQAFNSNDFAACIEAMTKALALDPANGSAQYLLALALINTGDLEAAIVALKKYQEIAPDGEHAAEVQGYIDALSGGS